MATNQHTIQLNGQESRIPDGTNLKSFLEARGINPNLVACELNLKVVKRAELQTVVLKEGDVLEVLNMIGGG